MFECGKKGFVFENEMMAVFGVAGEVSEEGYGSSVRWRCVLVGDFDECLYQEVASCEVELR